MDGWTWEYEEYEPDQEGLREALCTVGNGYLATRGAAPESVADEVHYPGTYAAGIYNRRPARVGEHRVENESLVNLPNWLPLTFRFDGGPWFTLQPEKLLDYRQWLDLREGVLTRWFRFRDGAGRTSTVTQRRFVDMSQPHICALETAVRAEDWDGTVEFESGLDGRVRNTLVRRYRDLPSVHLEPARGRQVSDDSVLLETRTNDSRIPVTMAARSILRSGREPVAPERSLETAPGWIGHRLRASIAAGEELTVEKTVTVFTGYDKAIYEPAVDAVRLLANQGSFDELLRGHVLAWRHLWDRFRIEMDHDLDAERIVRLHVFHLLATVSPNSADLDVGVPARGLHGEAYRGYVQWDELFVMPVLNLRLPALARSLLRYRWRRLPEARRAAAEAGYAGAMFPWQSGSSGREESQQLHLNPRSGRWIPDTTWRQRHIGLAVAYNVWQYYQASGDVEFLANYGARMLVEIAQFFSSIASFDQLRGRYVIRGVMGPDEFHTGYPGAEQDGIDNNAYTNLLTVWVLLRAREAMGQLPDRVCRELTEELNLSGAELERWDEISRRMFIPFHDDGVISQFEGYEQLSELDWDRYRARYGDIHRLDRILEAEGDSVNRYQASKQADVLMLFYLLSTRELSELLARLGYRPDLATVPKTIDYYLARTSHGSTLSAVVHAWVLARSRRERALEFFGDVLRSDVNDIQGGTTPEGIHLAAMAGSVDLVQRCFSGLETRGDQLCLDPYWPEPLGVLTLSILYREHPLVLKISGSGVEVIADTGMRRPVEVACRGQVATLKPGSTVQFEA